MSLQISYGKWFESGTSTLLTMGIDLGCMNRSEERIDASTLIPSCL
jgi:hypothetical protein